MAPSQIAQRRQDQGSGDGDEAEKAAPSPPAPAGESPAVKKVPDLVVVTASRRDLLGEEEDRNPLGPAAADASAAEGGRRFGRMNPALTKFAGLTTSTDSGVDAASRPYTARAVVNVRERKPPDDQELLPRVSHSSSTSTSSYNSAVSDPGEQHGREGRGQERGHGQERQEGKEVQLREQEEALFDDGDDDIYRQVTSSEASEGGRRSTGKSIIMKKFLQQQQHEEKSEGCSGFHVDQMHHGHRHRRCGQEGTPKVAEEESPKAKYQQMKKTLGEKHQTKNEKMLKFMTPSDAERPAMMGKEPGITTPSPEQDKRSNDVNLAPKTEGVTFSRLRGLALSRQRRKQVQEEVAQPQPQQPQQPPQPPPQQQKPPPQQQPKVPKEHLPEERPARRTEPHCASSSSDSERTRRRLRGSTYANNTLP